MAVVALLLVVVCITACNVTRSIPDGEYLLTKVNIEADKSVATEERITEDKDNLDIYVRQSPNKRILGFDFYVWVYQKANPNKTNWWNNFKRKVGQAPVLVDSMLTERSIINLETYLKERGYFSSDVTCRIDTSRRHRANVTYSIKQGEPMRIDTLRYAILDTSLYSTIMADTTSCVIHSGDILDIQLLNEERARIAKTLNDRGYFDFTINNISYEVDTIGRANTASVVMEVRPTVVRLEGKLAVYEDNAIYRLRNINVYPTYDPALRSTSGFKAGAVIDTVSYNGLNIMRDVDATPQLRSGVLRRIISLYPNYLYNAQQVAHTYNELMSLGFFNNSRIAFSRVEGEGNYVTFVGADNGDEEELRNTQERFLDCDIYCSPALKQSMKVELEASTTSTFYGISATLGYTNNNVFRGAEVFDVALRMGYEFMYAPDAAKRNAQEIGLTAGLSFPRFLAPFRLSYNSRLSQPRTRLELSFDYQNRPYYRRNLSSLRWAYSWKYGNPSSFVLRPIDINWIDVKSVDKEFLADIDNQYLRTSFESQLNAGLSFMYMFNNQLDNDHNNATVVRANFESAGNLIHGLERLFSHPAAGKDYYEILGVRYSQYVRADVSASRKIALGHNMALAGRLFAGVGVTYGNSAGRSIPFDRMFYCGGANSMRGWVPRTLGPGNKPQVEDSLYPSQVGDVRLEANLEFRFPIYSVFHGALFFDAGNVWYLRDTEDNNPEEVFHFNSFYKQLGFNTGLGIRIDIKFVILRLDLGLQLHNPGRPVGERWIHDFKWDNMALNFGVGYPF